MGKTRICTVCARNVTLTANGTIRLHRVAGVACNGSARPPKEKASAKGWTAQRRRCLERDKHHCVKCLATRGLEAHHMKERCNGGSDDLDNLITLCGLCHDEWTWTQPGSMDFKMWLLVPPARNLVPLFTLYWPDDMSAADFRLFILGAMDEVRKQHEARQ